MKYCKYLELLMEIKNVSVLTDTLTYVLSIKDSYYVSYVHHEQPKYLDKIDIVRMIQISCTNNNTFASMYLGKLIISNE